MTSPLMGEGIAHAATAAEYGLGKGQLREALAFCEAHRQQMNSDIEVQRRLKPPEW